MQSQNKKRRKSKYSSTSLSFDQRELLEKLWVFCSDSKKNSQFFRNFCEYIDCNIPRQTLFVWKKRILSGKNFHHTPNKLGRPQHYTELQKQRVVGMIINANLDNFVVDIEKVMDFFEEVTSRKPKSDYC